MGENDQIVTTAGELKKMISEAVTSSIGNCQIACPLDKPLQQNISHWMGMVKDVGGGDSVERGIEAIRLNHIFTTGLRGTLSSTAKKSWFAVLLILITGLVMAFWEGFRHFAGVGK